MRRLKFSHLSFLLLGACLCLPVIGCGGDAATTSAPAAAPAADEGSDSSEESSTAGEEEGSDEKE